MTRWTEEDAFTWYKRIGVVRGCRTPSLPILELPNGGPVAVGPKRKYLPIMATDRGEMKNLAAAQPGKVAELDAAWNRIAEQCRAIATSGAISNTDVQLENNTKMQPHKAKD